MSHWLIVYKRSEGKLLQLDPYADGQLALEARFTLERGQYRDDRDVEIVVLGADSLDDLKHTHGRYFYTLRELAALR